MEQKLREALRAALRARDKVATAALRSALSAVDNATAVRDPAPEAAAVGDAAPDAAPGGGPTGDSGAGPIVRGDEHVAGSLLGVGAAEVPRRELTDADVVALVRVEVEERLTAAAQYPPGPAADRLRAEATVLSTLLAAPPT